MSTANDLQNAFDIIDKELKPLDPDQSINCIS
jgi:hypothetical protein